MPPAKATAAKKAATPAPPAPPLEDDVPADDVAGDDVDVLEHDAEPVNHMGRTVRYQWDDPIDGPSERAGVVVDQLENGNVVLAWLDLSGPMDPDALEDL